MEGDQHLGLQLKPRVLHHMEPKAMMIIDESNERTEQTCGLQSNIFRTFNEIIIACVSKIQVLRQAKRTLSRSLISA
jgi:hypothetical protein